MSWLVSIGIWLCIMVGFMMEFSAHNQLWSEVFWMNFLLFLAAGIGVAATTHVAASALPLLLGAMYLASTDVKGGAVLSLFYVIAATVIGLLSMIYNIIDWLHLSWPARSDPE